MQTKRLAVVDISSFIFRAFFAIRPLTSPDKVPVNAVYGVLKMILKLLSSYRPSHIVLARDTRGGSFRNQVYAEYKANRSEPPDDLKPQFKIIEDLISKLQIPNIQLEGFEADDIIGSICVQWKKDFDEIMIVSGDKDLMQFVGDHVYMLDTMKDVKYSRQEVFDKMNVWPEQMVDYLSMVGDSSDNIPGMRGIGAKGAADLLATYKTLENIYEHKAELKGKKVIESFENFYDAGLLSKSLIQIKTDLELVLSADQSHFNFYPSNELLEFLRSLGFKSMVTEIEEMKYHQHQVEKNDLELNSLVTPVPDPLFHHIHVLDSDFEKFIQDLKDAEEISFYTSYSSEDLFVKSLDKIFIAINDEVSFSVDVTPANESKLLATIFQSNKHIFTHDAKRDFAYLYLKNIEVSSIVYDIEQMHYIVDVDTRHDLETISQMYLNQIYGGNLELAGLFIRKIGIKLITELKKNDLFKFYETIDGPLIPILAKMEARGVLINRGYFKELEVEYTKDLLKLDEDIHKIIEEALGTSEKINLRSTKQVGELLFDRLGLPVVKKTKTGYSTDSEVLEKLELMGASPIPTLLLKYRELEKLNSTYVKALPELINPTSGRIHTHFNQHVAATGRLSSVNPNLQNIPIRSIEGRRLRKGFIANPGDLLVSADYSQVELRILAHFSQDPTMLKAFLNNEDIHAQTASEVLDIPLDKITSNHRSMAKAVNFGLMYGQGSFGLANVLKISRTEAKDYITKYFERFSSIKQFLDTLKEKAEKTGYSETLHGRKRYLRDIHSSNRMMKDAAERLAVNSPIQGTAADIIKLAMIEIENDFTTKNLKSKMLLQVHDELIFNVKEEELETVKSIIKTRMENVVELKVPLKVDMGIGVNWFDLK